MKIFISYSHETSEHNDRVLKLADALRAHGVDAEVDRYEPPPPNGWARWCEERLRPENAQFVLVICTKGYRARVEGKVPANEGQGVYWEGTIIFNYLYAKDNRFIPILFDGGDVGDIPVPLQQLHHYRLRAFDLGDPGYETLYRAITDQHGVGKPELGARIALSGSATSVRAALPRGEIRTLFQGMLQIVQVTDLDSQRDDLFRALPLYERLPEDDRLLSADLVEMTRRHLSDELGDRWKNYVLIAKCADNVVGFLLGYDDVQENFSFISCLAARKPRHGGINPRDISREMLVGLKELIGRQGTSGRKARILCEVESPACTDDPDEKRLRQSRLRLFGSIASVEHMGLRCLGLPYLQPRMDLRLTIPPRELLLLYTEEKEAVPEAIPREDAVAILKWLYLELYEDVHETEDERRRFATHTKDLLGRVTANLPELVPLRRIRDLVGRERP